jgi:hypothetical protein
MGVGDDGGVPNRGAPLIPGNPPPIARPANGVPEAQSRKPPLRPFRIPRPEPISTARRHFPGRRRTKRAPRKAANRPRRDSFLQWGAIRFGNGVSGGGGMGPICTACHRFPGRRRTQRAPRNAANNPPGNGGMVGRREGVARGPLREAFRRDSPRPPQVASLTPQVSSLALQVVGLVWQLTEPGHRGSSSSLLRSSLELSDTQGYEP